MQAYLIAIGTIAAIYVLLALGLTLQYGLTGLINFGHVGFFAIGAYTSALLALAGVPVALSLAAGAALAALVAWPIGLVALRLREDYFAVVTLGFGETVRLVITSERWLTNGVQGIPGIPRLFPVEQGEAGATVTLIVLCVCCLVAALVLRRVARSPFGRMIEAIRDNEDAVRALGKNPAAFKTRVLALGSALAGLGGGFYAHVITYLSPDQFTALVTFYVWMAMILGGVGRVSGAVLGALLLMAFLEGTRFVRDVLPGVVSEVEMASVRLGAVGLALILFTLFRPQGLVGDYSRR